MRYNKTISQKEYDIFSMEYKQILKEYVIPKGNDVILDEVWNL